MRSAGYAGGSQRPGGGEKADRPGWVECAAR
ncbi:hypothetical protein P3T27_007881 [Kitasatospora sp. MAA19]|nr:hypothetical protein [Kitasatospora sp. MAA19]